MLHPARTARAFVLGAFMPNGGTYMAYHVARLFQDAFGFEPVAVVVDGETPDHGVFRYDRTFPSVAIEEMERAITARDVLLANAGHSRYVFGPRLPGRKLMYVQHFVTARPLDVCFDMYVSVSSFVQRYLKTLYDVEAPLIPPFVELDRMPSVAPWEDRAPGSVVVHVKTSHPDLDALRAVLRRRGVAIALDDVLPLGLTHDEYLRRIGAARHLVTVASAEGFGLVALEAMALGTTVLGFDGYGGRDFLRDGVNAACTAYGDFVGLATRIAATVGDPARAARLADGGHRTAAGYGYEPFREAWTARIAQFLNATARG